MAQGYETFADAKAAAQKMANRSGSEMEVWRGSPTAKRFKFQTCCTANRSRLLMKVKPEQKASCGNAQRGKCACGQPRGHF